MDRIWRKIVDLWQRLIVRSGFQQWALGTGERIYFRADVAVAGVLDRVAPREIVEGSFVDAVPEARDPLGQWLTRDIGDSLIIYGTIEGDPIGTPVNASLQVVGPPQGIKGKTTSVMIPALLAHRGTSIVFSVKTDIPVYTALVQSLKGPVYQFSPDGSSIIPGAIQLGYSLLTKDWATAMGRAQILVKSAGISDEGKGSATFFNLRAEQLIAPLLLYGGLKDLDDEWFVQRVNVGIEDPDHEWERILTTLEHANESMAATALRGIVHNPSDRTTGDVFGTASAIVKPFNLPGVMEMTKRRPLANFDELVRGEPYAPSHVLSTDPYGLSRPRPLPGWYPTIYINASQDTISAVGGIIQAFLYDARRACIKLNEEDLLTGRRRSAATLCILDEMASCPIPDLPAMLRDSSSQLFMLVAGFQSFAQHEIWGNEGKGLNDLFPTTLVLPGLRYGLEQWSKLIGNYDRENWGGSYGYDHNSKQVWNASLSWSRDPLMPESQIFQGNPIDPDCALSIQGNAWGWVKLNDAYKGHPWPYVIAHAAWRASQIPEVRDLGLPWPGLVRNGDTRYLHAISPQFAQWFMENRRQYNNYHGRAS